MKKNRITTIVLAMAVCLMMGACSNSESSTSSSTKAGSATAAEGSWETYTPETSSSESSAESAAVSTKASDEQTEDTAEKSSDDVQAVPANSSGEKLNITNEVVTQYTYYTRDALRKAANDIAVFAQAEGLTGHARSALIRTEED